MSDEKKLAAAVYALNALVPSAGLDVMLPASGGILFVRDLPDRISREHLALTAPKAKEWVEGAIWAAKLMIAEGDES